MTKKQWINHMIEATGVTPGAKADWRSDWNNEKHRHMQENPDCPECAARQKTRQAIKNRNWKDEAYKAVGMKKVRGSAGGTFWEDILKFGTREEIEFLREAFIPFSVKNPELKKPGDVVIYKMKPHVVIKVVPGIGDPDKRMLLVRQKNDIRSKPFSIAEDDIL
jgi:hypothetical protein